MFLEKRRSSSATSRFFRDAGWLDLVSIIFPYHYYICCSLSPFLSELLEQHEDQEEPVNITLAGVEYRELMAMMNLIYVGK